MALALTLVAAPTAFAQGGAPLGGEEEPDLSTWPVALSELDALVLVGVIHPDSAAGRAGRVIYSHVTRLEELVETDTAADSLAGLLAALRTERAMLRAERDTARAERDQFAAQVEALLAQLDSAPADCEEAVEDALAMAAEMHAEQLAQRLAAVRSAAAAVRERALAIAREEADVRRETNRIITDAGALVQLTQ